MSEGGKFSSDDGKIKTFLDRKTGAASVLNWLLKQAQLHLSPLSTSVCTTTSTTKRKKYLNRSCSKKCSFMLSFLRVPYKTKGFCRCSSIVFLASSDNSDKRSPGRCFLPPPKKDQH